MKTPLACWNSGDPASFESVVQDLATYESRVCCRRRLVLQLEE